MSPFIHVAWPSVVPGSIDLRVGAVRDSISATSTYWGQTDPLYWTGNLESNHALRFTNVLIPAGATITTARLTVYTAANMLGAGSTNAVSVAAEAVDSPAQLSSLSDHNTRKSDITTAAVSWYIWEANGPLEGADQPMLSPSITSVVQEIVNRAGWASGNNMQFFAQVTSYAASYGMRSYYNGVTASYPRLEVEWT